MGSHISQNQTLPDKLFQPLSLFQLGYLKLGYYTAH